MPQQRIEVKHGRTAVVNKPIFSLGEIIAMKLICYLLRHNSGASIFKVLDVNFILGAEASSIIIKVEQNIYDFVDDERWFNLF